MSSIGKANSALVAAVLFLLLSSCAAYLAFARLQTTQDWVHHTREVQHSLDHYSTTMARASRLRAEYVDSGDPSLVQQQAAAVVDVRNNLSAIQRLTADNVTQQDGIRKLVEFTERRIALLGKAIELKRSGKSTLEAQAAISREIIAIANETDTILRAMDDEEQRLLLERQKREALSIYVIAGTLVTSLLIALVLFLVDHKLLSDEVRNRVRAENAQRALSARLQTVQDEERRRFARELHDSVGQELAAMKMALSMLAARLPGDAIVVDCLKLVDDSIAKTRTISHLLHPPLLDEAGLNSAIRWFLEGFSKRSGIGVNLQLQDDVDRFEPNVELALFRALQECLTNVHRHSGAKQAEIGLSLSGSQAILTVKDDGRGIPADVLLNLKGNGSGGGVGLASMTERIREVGGHLVIESNGRGTEIIARVPVRRRVSKAQILPSNSRQVAG